MARQFQVIRTIARAEVAAASELRVRSAAYAVRWTSDDGAAVVWVGRGARPEDAMDRAEEACRSEGHHGGWLDVFRLI